MCAYVSVVKGFIKNSLLSMSLTTLYSMMFLIHFPFIRQLLTVVFTELCATQFGKPHAEQHVSAMLRQRVSVSCPTSFVDVQSYFSYR